MNSECDEHKNEKPMIRCSECGNDVRTRRSPKQKWTHRSRVIPRVIWIVLVGGLVGYGLYGGGWQYSTRQMPLVSSWVPPNAQGSSFTRDPQGQDVSYLGLSELELAIGQSDEESNEQVDVQSEETMARFGEQIREAVDRYDWIVAGELKGAKPESVQFGLKEARGILIEDTVFSFFGRWLSKGHSDRLSDIRDPSSVEENPYLTESQVRWAIRPGLQYSRTLPGGYRQETVTLSMLTILGILSMCMLLTACIRWIGTRGLVKNKAGIVYRLCDWRWGAVVICLVLFMGSGLIAGVNAKSSERTISQAYRDIALSPEYSIDELRAAMVDPEKARAIGQVIVDLIPDLRAKQKANLQAGVQGTAFFYIPDEEMLIGQLWKYERPVSPKFTGSQAGLKTHWLRISVGYWMTFLDWNKQVYTTQGAVLPYAGGVWKETWSSLYEFGMLTVRWTGDLSRTRVMVMPMNLVLVPMILYWVWRGLHGTSRLLIRLMQRRRERRNQCIFCAYPLSHEATLARYPDPGS